MEKDRKICNLHLLTHTDVLNEHSLLNVLAKVKNIWKMNININKQRNCFFLYFIPVEFFKPIQTEKQ